MRMQRTGVYVLVGYRNADDDLPTLYIGQADGIKGRIDSHHKDKEFWDWASAFVSTSGGAEPGARHLARIWRSSSGQWRQDAVTSTTATRPRSLL